MTFRIANLLDLTTIESVYNVYLRIPRADEKGALGLLLPSKSVQLDSHLNYEAD